VEQNNNNRKRRKYTIDEILSRDRTNLDIFWLKNESLIDLENMADAETLIDSIIKNVETALNNFKTIKEAITDEEK